MPRLRVEVQGVVQGVGFRPGVHRLARARGLTGRVWNHPGGVTVEVQGPPAALEAFLQALRHQVPPPARVTGLQAVPVPEAAGEVDFRIAASTGAGGGRAGLPPDLAPCPDCVAELEDPGARRHRYPFTACARCGPRYTILGDLPYDRPATALRGFPLCPDCRREYEDPGDRRFHAQPLACPACGPRLTLADPGGRVQAVGAAALGAAVDRLRAGQVLAVKGLGGYQLMVDATCEAAVARLRARKHREAKPLAVLFQDLAQLRASCRVSVAAQRLLASPEAPILLLPRRPGSPVAALVAPGNPRLGALLPTTPLHRLLAQAVARPLVCTSGNLSEEPMAFRNEEAQARLGGVAEAFLHHDRPILRPVDDSVLRLDADGPTLLRRARGFAPLALDLSLDGGCVLALGAQQKNTVALLQARRVVLSPHLGDLHTAEGADLQARTVEDLLAFHRAAPEVVACDLHPDYASTRLAERLAGAWGVPLVRVQHHHAHGAACAAEHHLEGPVLALAWDGSGLGPDGTLWGGEALRLEGAGFTRVGHLRPFPLPGGEAAVREPRRSACGLLWACRGPGAPPTGLACAFGEGDWERLQILAARGVNSPRTSSLGRLFDAVAALTGLQAGPGFEGQAALALEAAAGSRTAPAYTWDLADGVADPSALVAELLRDLASGRRAGLVAARFHRALADLALAWARRAGLAQVVLSGGCFQNARLVAEVTERLTAAGFRVHRHRQVPPNDGGLSLGQAAVAALRP